MSDTLEVFLGGSRAPPAPEAGGGAQIRPLEEAYKFGGFFSSLLNESDFSAKPSVLLLGQYSTGEARCWKSQAGSKLLRPCVPSLVRHGTAHGLPGVQGVTEKRR